MSDAKQFKLPDVGEGLTEAEIVSWKVAAGDTVAVNDVLVEIETAKSLVELPSPYAGTVTELLVAEGATVDVGTPIITIGGTAAPGSSGPAAPAALAHTDAVPAPETPAQSSNQSSAQAEGRTAVLVGYGPRTVEAKRRPRKSASAPEAAPVQSSTNGSAPGRVVLAKPPVRKLAKSLGVDLSSLEPSGPGGVVTRSDVEAAAGQGSGQSPAPARSVRAEGDIRVPVKGVRKATAAAMVASAFTAPHVTEWVQVDVTRSMELLERLGRRRDFAGVRLSPLVLVMKALTVAISRHPEVNASWDESAQEIVIHRDVNLGIAAATPRGLLVPNIKAADRQSLTELAGSLTQLVHTAREGKTPPADMQGGTITITNVGVFGVDGGTPILNPGEAAILCFGAVRWLPWVVDGAVVPRQVTTLSLSFDHRLVDGELGSKFLADIAAMLEDPALLGAWA